MAKKRKYHTSLETQSCDPKRQRSSLDPQSAYLSIPHPDISNHPLRARVEQPSTQRTAFPGLDDDNEADLDHETSVEALAYLRSVRAQASLLPPVLHNRTPAEDAALLHDLKSEPSRGYYADGAYVAAPAPLVLGPARPAATAESPMLDAQDVCHAALLRRFYALRARLRRQPPVLDVEGLNPAVNPFESVAGCRGGREVKRWKTVLLKEMPKMVQIAAMDGQLVLKLVEVLGWLLPRRRLLYCESGGFGDAEVAEGDDCRRLGAWAWVLLGKVGDMGTLSSEEIAVIRGLGKGAVELVRKWAGVNDECEHYLEDEGHSEEQEDEELEEGMVDEREGNTSSEDEANEEEDEIMVRTQPLAETDAPSNPPDMLKKAQASLLKRLALPAPSANASNVGHTAFATLNAILTIVGDCYGQRDLLKARNMLWEMGLETESGLSIG